MSLDSENLSVEDSETVNSFYQLASLVSLILSKKINFQQLFILILSDKKINQLAKLLTDIDSDMSLCRFLLEIEPSLIKSKAITSFINCTLHAYP